MTGVETMVIDSMIPVQDLIIIQLLREGVSFNDLADIREEDINFEKNTINIKGQEKNVSQYCIELIQEAIGSPFYFNDNDEIIPLEDNGYIIKNLVEPFKKVDAEQLRQRINNAKSNYGLELPACW